VNSEQMFYVQIPLTPDGINLYRIS